ncbi:MAG: Na+/H+ antiporter subunit E [Acidobacteriota bacterium]
MAAESPGDRRAAAFLAGVMIALWMALSGSLALHHPLLFWAGIASALGVTALAWRMGIVNREVMPLHLLPGLVIYIPWLLKEMVVSSIDVLRRGVVRPRIQPEVLTLPADRMSDLGLVSYANSITLTPGTTTLDSDVEADTIEVHAIDSDVADALRGGEMARRVRAVEGPVDDAADGGQHR